MVSSDSSSDEEDGWDQNDHRGKLENLSPSMLHRLNHQPKNSKCEACVRGKTKHRRMLRLAYRRRRKRKAPAEYGDLFNCDYVSMPTGIRGRKAFFTMFDQATGCLYADPVKDQDTLQTLDCPNYQRGYDDIHRILQAMPDVSSVRARCSAFPMKVPTWYP